MKFFKNKKGIFFTLIAIMLVTFLIMNFSMEIDYKYTDQISMESAQISSTNNFVKNLDEDIEKGVYISSFRALVTQLDYITENGSFVTDAEATFFELMVNGTLYGEPKDKMNGSTILDWYENFKEKSENANIIFDMDIKSFEIKQISPWVIRTSLTVDINVTDTKHLASWSMEKNVNSTLNIVGFEDPVYTVKTFGRIIKNVKPASYSRWNITNTKNMFLETRYRPSNRAPSYFMRLEGDLSNSTNGIESFVNVKEIFEAGLDELIYNNSAVDHIYWTTSESGEYKIYGITDEGYPNFKLDNLSTVIYNVSGQTYN